MLQEPEKLQVFSFDFLVEKLSFFSSKCALPGVAFQFSDFPPLLVEPALKRRQKNNNLSVPATQRAQMDIHRCRKEGSVQFNKGKSCHFEMTYLELVHCVKTSAVQVSIVDLLTVENGSPKVIGRATIDLTPPTTDQIPEVVSHGKKMVNIVDSLGKQVATVYVRHQLTTVGEEVGISCQTEGTGGSQDCTDTADKPEPQPVCLQFLGGSAVATVKSSAVTSESLHPTGRSESSRKYRDVSVQTSRAAASTPSRNSPDSDNVSEVDPEPLLLYLPNSVCPPPLFYHCPPAPPCLPHARTEAVDFPEVSLSSHSFPVPRLCGDLHLGGSSSAMQHWTAVMAHDQRNHPIASVEENGGITKQTPSHDQCQANRDVKTGGLPLLTALLEELALLKSHIDSVQSQPRSTVPVASSRKEPEKATKCLQTDFTPTPTIGADVLPSSQTTSNSPSSPPPPSLPSHRHRQGRSKRFLRECCGGKFTSSPRVPKRKSVIYGADILHKHRKGVLSAGPGTTRGHSARKPKTKATNVCSTPEQGSKRVGKVKQSAPQPKDFDHSIPKEHGTPPGTELPHRPVSSSSSVRKLEVFIPQVTPEADTPAEINVSRSSVESVESQISFEAQTNETQQEDGESKVVSHQLQTSQLQSRMSTGSTSLSNVSSKELELHACKSHHSVVSQPGSACSLQVAPSSPPPLSPPRLSSSEIDQLRESESELAMTPLPSEATSPKPETLPPTSRDVSIVVIDASTPRRTSVSPAPTLVPSRFLSGRRLSMDLGSPGTLNRKHGSFLNVAGSQTLESFMSMDSLDIAASTVLPKHQRGGVVYLASSQSSFGGSEQNVATGTGDAYAGNFRVVPVDDGSPSAGTESNVEELTVTLSQDDYSLQYSDDFEQFDSRSSDSSSS